MFYSNPIQWPAICVCFAVDIPFASGALSYLQPLHEWILTDSCASSTNQYANTGFSNLSSMTVGSVVSTAPSWSNFFGNTITSSNLYLSAAAIQISSSDSISMFYWFMLLETTSKFIVAQFKFTQTTIHVISLTYDSGAFKFYANLSGEHLKNAITVV